MRYVWIRNQVIVPIDGEYSWATVKDARQAMGKRNTYARLTKVTEKEFKELTRPTAPELDQILNTLYDSSTQLDRPDLRDVYIMFFEHIKHVYGLDKDLTDAVDTAIAKINRDSQITWNDVEAIHSIWRKPTHPIQNKLMIYSLKTRHPHADWDKS